jgi:hypothetical protein
MVGELDPMSKTDEYLNNAAETVELASRASSSADKSRLLRLAGRWLDLAERAGRLVRRSKSPVGEHPLVTRVLGDGDLDRSTRIDHA